MNWVLAILFFFPILGWSLEDNIQNFSAKINLSNNEVNLQNNVDLQLILLYPKNYHIDLEVLKKNLLRQSAIKLPPFAIESVQEHKEIHSDIVTHNLDFILKPLIPGNFQLTFYEITFIPNNSSLDKKIVLISEIKQIKVNLGDLISLDKIKISPLLNLTLRFPIEISEANRQKLIDNPLALKLEVERNQAIFNQSTLPWTNILLFIIGLLMLWAIRNAPRSKENPKVTLIQAREKALKNILSLQEKKLCSPEFYTELTNIVRNYIEEHYKLNAPTLTTPEFLKELSESKSFNEETRQRLIFFMQTADLVKFGGQEPSAEECLQAKNTAQSFILAES
jgi:hypothetical protein